MSGPSRRRLLQAGLAFGGLSLLSGCSRLPTQSRPRGPWRVGFLGIAPQPYHEAFFQGLRDLGYVEGQTVVFERRYPGAAQPRLSILGAELVQLPVDVLVAAGTAGLLRDLTTTIPIVTILNDSVEAGFARSLARPGGNVTGINLSNAALATKRLELLKQTFPAISRVAVLENGVDTLAQVRAVDSVASTVGVTLSHYDLRTFESYSATLKAAGNDRPDAILPLDQPSLTAQRSQVIAFAAQHQMPVMYVQRVYADDGGVIAYGPNYAEMFRRLAIFADKILKGANPGEIPMEQPTTFDFVVNLKTAQALGLTIPQSVLQQATEVMQ